MQKNKKTYSQKEITGKVLSDRMDKTIVVRTSRLTVHPVFKKTIRRFSKFKAHDEKKMAKIGDTVKIRLCRPLSKDKRWQLVEIIEKASQHN